MAVFARLGASWQPRVLSILRLVSGLLFLEHGTAKLLGFPYSVRYEHLELFSRLGLAGTIEMVGGFLVAIGLYTRPAAFIMSGEMAFAYYLSHASRNFFPLFNGGDASILFCFVFFYLFVAGGGSWSADRWLRRVSA